MKRRIYFAACVLMVALSSVWASDEVTDLSLFLHDNGVETQGCTTSRPGKRPKIVFFVFEGLNGYSDELGSNFRRFQSLDPVCATSAQPDGSSHSVVQFSNGKWMDFDRLINQFHGMVRNDAGGSPVALKNLVLNGLCKQTGFHFEDIEVFYASEAAELQPTVDCAKQFAQSIYTDPDLTVYYPKISILGFSNGGDRAIELSHVLDLGNVKIDYGATVDPIPRGIRGAVAIAARAADPVNSRKLDDYWVPGYIGWHNYWQETDNRLTAFEEPLQVQAPKGLHGFKVENAWNVLVVPPLDPAQPFPNGAHWRIFFSKEVLPEIARHLVSLAKEPAKTKWTK